MHHRDLVEIREVGGTNVVDFRFSSSGRMACTTSHSYWLRISHILMWMRAEVSFHRDWTTWVSFFQWEGLSVDKSQVNREKIAPLHIWPFPILYRSFMTLTEPRHGFTKGPATLFGGKNIKMPFQTYTTLHSGDLQSTPSQTGIPKVHRCHRSPLIRRGQFLIFKNGLRSSTPPTLAFNSSFSSCSVTKA